MLDIRSMDRADLDAVVALGAVSGWRRRASFYELALRLPVCQPLVASRDGRIVGSGIATVNGAVGWLGSILVAPDVRRQGIGTAITEAICARLEAAGCRSLVLVATDLGRPVYERLGFRPQSQYHLLRAEPLAEPPASGPGTALRPFEDRDFEALRAMDRLVTGEDRSVLLRAHAASGWVLEDGAGLRGFLMQAESGMGPVVAPDRADGIVLLDLRRHLVAEGHHARAGVLEQNAAGLEALEARGWQSTWVGPRLVRGESPAWQPTAIWGLFNFAMG